MPAQLTAVEFSYQRGGGGRRGVHQQNDLDRSTGRSSSLGTYSFFARLAERPELSLSVALFTRRQKVHPRESTLTGRRARRASNSREISDKGTDEPDAWRREKKEEQDRDDGGKENERERGLVSLRSYDVDDPRGAETAVSLLHLPPSPPASPSLLLS